MRLLAVAALLVACADAPPEDAASFEFRLRFDRNDGSVIVNGEPYTERLVFTADSYAVAQDQIVLDVSATTTTGTITTQLRPGFCATSVLVDRGRIGTIVLEGLGYVVLESTPPDLELSTFVCDGTNGGTAGGP